MKRLYDYTVILRPTKTMVHSWPMYLQFLAAMPGTPQEAQMELTNVFEMIRDEYKEEGRMLPADIDALATHACQS